MKKGVLTAVLLGVIMLTGCSVDQKVTINNDFSSDVVMDCYTTAAEEDAIMQSMYDMGADKSTTFQQMMESMEFDCAGTEMINGVENNRYTIESKNSANDTKGMFMELTNQKAVYNIATQTETQTQQMSGSTSMDYGDMGFFRFTVKYPFKVAKANGVLQSDGCTVVYDILDLNKKKVSRIYAIGASALSASDKVTIKGVKNKKAYKKPVTVKATCDGVITSFKVNGVDQAVNSYYAKKNGKYVVEIETASGKKVSCNFCVDNKKPTTNIKNKKTYKKNVKIKFKDSISVIKKATLNGKKIKSGKKVKKNGNYVLKIYDKAGNVKKIKFTIKK